MVEERHALSKQCLSPYRLGLIRLALSRHYTAGLLPRGHMPWQGISLRFPAMPGCVLQASVAKQGGSGASFGAHCPQRSHNQRAAVISTFYRYMQSPQTISTTHSQPASSNEGCSGHLATCRSIIHTLTTYCFSTATDLLCVAWAQQTAVLMHVCASAANSSCAGDAGWCVVAVR
jgi:hypothetical protein